MGVVTMKELEDKKETRTWRPFTEARAFVHTLGLKSKAAWQAYSKSGVRPPDVPSNPDKIYPTEFRGFGDWLGTGTIASFNRQYRPFPEARAFVHRLNFKSSKQWREYCKSGQKPHDIPTMPERYGSEFKGYGDWLGTGNVAPTKRVFRPFTEARAYVRSLKIENQDAWLDYCRSDKRPDDIPVNPDSVYLAEFESYGDWLGNENISTWKRVYRPFTEARDFVHTLELKNSAQWYAYCKAGKKPDDIPSHPQQVYRAEYQGMDDWLGTGRTRNYRPFAEARAIVHTQDLTSYKQWIEYCQSGKKPPDIPSAPWRRYRAEYKSIADWLGTEYLQFSEARAFVQAQGLKNHRDWLNYRRSSKKPKYIPSKPEQVYRSEYKGMKDWLGVVDKWNSDTLLTFLHDLQPQLDNLTKKDLVHILQRNDTLNPLRKVLGGATPMRVLKDLMKNGGRELERALREMPKHQGEVETILDSKPANTEPPQVRDQVFISYSRKDKKWKDRLQTTLKPLTREGKIKVWADTQIEAGNKWREDISNALATAKVAVLLVTQNFLASDFIASNELPPLLGAAEKEGLVILWIAVSSSMFKETAIEQYQAVNDPSRPLDDLTTAKQNKELTRIGEEIKKAMFSRSDEASVKA
jgi:TIR domain/Phage-integrase repeat unit